MKRYLNIITSYGVETVEELDSKNFATFEEFRVELRRLASEYHTAGMHIYISQRCDKNWNNNN